MIFDPVLETFRFLTILPLPGSKRVGEGTLARSVSFFPLVGATLGALFVLLDWACGHAFPRFPFFLSAAVILVFYALSTGCLHHDGFIDVADAIWGARSKPMAKQLEILKDSRVGAIGVSALSLLMFLEFAAISSLPEHVGGAPGRFRWASLLAFPILGRWVMSYLCVRFPYARERGTGAAMIGLSRPLHLAIATVIAAAGLAACFVWMVRLPMLIAVLAVTALVFAECAGGLFARLLGGVTGDVIGATGMMAEALVVALLASRIPELLA